jgi:hypothetical protein
MSQHGQSLSIGDALRKISTSEGLDKEELRKLIEAAELNEKRLRENEDKMAKLQTELQRLGGNGMSSGNIPQRPKDMIGVSTQKHELLGVDQFMSGYGYEDQGKESEMYQSGCEMNPSQPLFSGKLNEDVEEWLFITEVNMSAAGVHESRKVYVAAGYLRENALQVFRQMTRQRRDEPTWSEFKLEFARRFNSKQSNESIVQKLCSLSQNGALDAYVEKFTYLVNQGSLAEDVMVALFARGLSSDLHAEVKYRRPSTLKEAINIVMQYADAKLSGRSSDTYQLTPINYAYNRRENCFECGSPEHRTRECRRYNGKMCYNCGKFGHIQRQCAYSPDESDDSDDSDHEAQAERQKLLETILSEIGKLAKRCKKRQSNKPLAVAQKEETERREEPSEDATTDMHSSEDESSDEESVVEIEPSDDESQRRAKKRRTSQQDDEKQQPALYLYSVAQPQDEKEVIILGEDDDNAVETDDISPEETISFDHNQNVSNGESDNDVILLEDETASRKTEQTSNTRDVRASCDEEAPASHEDVQEASGQDEETSDNEFECEPLSSDDEESSNNEFECEPVSSDDEQTSVEVISLDETSSGFGSEITASESCTATPVKEGSVNQEKQLRLPVVLVSSSVIEKPNEVHVTNQSAVVEQQHSELQSSNGDRLDELLQRLKWVMESYRNKLENLTSGKETQNQQSKEWEWYTRKASRTRAEMETA